MQPVIQEDRAGCGLACVATIAGVTYREAKKVAGQLGIDVQDPQLWSDTKYVRQLLSHYGISTSSHPSHFKGWDSLPSPTLLAIKWHKKKSCPSWHWVVFWRGPDGPVVLDSKQSLQNHNRTDFGRIKPKWYLALTLPQSQLISE